MKQITKFNFSKLLTLAVFVLVLFVSGQQAKAESQDETIWMTLKDDLSNVDPGYIIKALYTPDEQSILVTTTTKRLFELDPATGKVRREIPGIAGVIQFSEDGQYVYTYNFEKVKWPSGELVGKYPVYGFTEFVINENVGLMVGVSYQSDHSPWLWKKGIWVLDLNTFKLIDTLGFTNNYFYSIQMTSDGKYFIAYSVYVPDWTKPDLNGYNQFVWDTKTLSAIPENNPINTIMKQLGKFTTSPNGKFLGDAGAPYVRVYDNQAFSNDLTLKIIYEWDPCYGCASSVTAFSPDSRYLLSIGPNCSYPNDPNDSLNMVKPRVWDLTTGKLVYIYHQGLSISDIKIYNNSTVLAYAGPGILLMKWMTGTGILEGKSTKILYPNPTNGIITIKNGKLIAGQPLQIAISDISGKTSKILYNGIYNGNEINLNISEYPAGTYLLQVNQKVQIATYKVIKEQ